MKLRQLKKYIDLHNVGIIAITDILSSDYFLISDISPKGQLTLTSDGIVTYVSPSGLFYRINDITTINRVLTTNRYDLSFIDSLDDYCACKHGARYDDQHHNPFTCGCNCPKCLGGGISSHQPSTSPDVGHDDSTTGSDVKPDNDLTRDPNTSVIYDEKDILDTFNAYIANGRKLTDDLIKKLPTTPFVDLSTIKSEWDLVDLNSIKSTNDLKED